MSHPRGRARVPGVAPQVRWGANVGKPWGEGPKTGIEVPNGPMRTGPNDQLCTGFSHPMDVAKFIYFGRGMRLS